MNETSFSETQNFRQPWVFALVALVLGGSLVFLWHGVYQQAVLSRPFGNHPAPTNILLGVTCLETIVCVVIGTMMASMKLVVELGRESILIRFIPLKKTEISLGAIRGCLAREYSPLQEFGGWGWRRSWDGKVRAFTMAGRRGVELSLKDGTSVMIGSQRADELAEAILRRLPPG